MPLSLLFTPWYLGLLFRSRRKMKGKAREEAMEATDRKTSDWGNEARYGRVREWVASFLFLFVCSPPRCAQGKNKLSGKQPPLDVRSDRVGDVLLLGDLVGDGAEVFWPCRRCRSC